MLSSGDHAVPFGLQDQNGKRYFLRDEVGTPIVLLFYASDTLESCAEIAITLQTIQVKLKALEVKVFSISKDDVKTRAALAKRHHLTFPLLSDSSLEISKQYGVCRVTDPTSDTMNFSRTLFLLDRNLRVLKVYTPVLEPHAVLQELLADIPALCQTHAPQLIRSQAPVLLIPNVLSREFCRELIEVWESEGNDDSGFMKQDGEKTVGVYDYNVKIRRDHFVRNPEMRKRLDRVVLRRIFPEIKKCFNYEVHCCEDYKIARYDSEPGGFFRQHRDNTTGGTAHRVWAMTLNLNAEEYEGGCLRFSEYGDDLYKPDTGSAAIFSCSMMHEATDVTAGQRFVLLAFFYSRIESEKRVAYESQHAIVPGVKPGQS